VAVSTAKEALDILSSEAPDGILAEAECQGQELSGKDLCAIVKTCPRLQHIPVILLTSSALPSDYATSHQIGSVVCMTIPCRPERVRSAIHLVAAPPALCSVYSARCNVASFVRTSSFVLPGISAIAPAAKKRTSSLSRRGSQKTNRCLNESKLEPVFRP
jgi:CheY-like chemotaxis protein